MSYRDDMGQATISDMARKEINLPNNKLESIGEVREKLNGLEKAVTAILSETIRLSKKIKPILRMKPSQDIVNPTATAPSETEIGMRIQELTDRSYQIVNNINELYDDVQL